jgi:hypothetical protein
VAAEYLSNNLNPLAGRRNLIVWVTAQGSFSPDRQSQTLNAANQIRGTTVNGEQY